MLLAILEAGLSDLFGKALLGLLMLAIGLGCAFVCFIGYVLLRHAILLSRYGIRVRARVVGNHVDPKDKEGTQYRIVEFRDLQGATHQSRLSMSSSDDLQVGQSMNVVYNPDNPGEVSGSTFASLWMPPIICCACGGIGVLFVVGYFCGIIPTN